MKKNIKLNLAGGILTLVISMAAQAQVSIASAPVTEAKRSAPVSITPGDNERMDSKWYEASYGFVAKFISDQIHYRVDFDKKGNWLSTIRTYDETKLPTGIKRLVKESYPGYTITLVEEVQMPARSLAYIIHVEGSSDLINLRVCDNEMDEWQKIYKSK